ncbi:Rieske 2Fe-2S domain-containing protein [Capillimicrobium parvum]|uniref:3-phenylpropionate/cinnamic acid dioxygenase ferredoxin subunit n=1 Tax=Capillimicrobium parvum TaxID=2884022 RepID=A0A9E6Y129_9ACTN|nr:Rieske (2Fe-2S) protein [Capillimicrobium parvum]UGS38195.1 3-phenylpropionate/cinnamic acid dioxygenase ferredoxin subunit [Capillimicrobium parvum]
MTATRAPRLAAAGRVARIAALDGPAKRAGKAVRGALSPGPLRDALAGTWLGHALHPVLTDTVIGTWMSATLLDVTGGDRAAARRLVGAGVIAALPTAVTGLADWADSEAADDGVRRVGAVHAVANNAALGLQVASLVARGRGRDGRGAALSLVAMGGVAASAYLGGYLSFERGVGVDQTAFDPGPADWTPAMAAADLREGETTSVVVGDTPVLLVRSGGRVRALHDRCSHRGCSLAEGDLDGDVIQCGCHGSRFRLDDGAIERGPATAPQPVLDVREADGSIDVRLASASALG